MSVVLQLSKTKFCTVKVNNIIDFAHEAFCFKKVMCRCTSLGKSLKHLVEIMSLFLEFLSQSTAIIPH